MLPAKEDQDSLKALVASCLQVIEAKPALSAATSFPANRFKEVGSLVQLEACTRKVSRLPESETKSVAKASFILTSAELLGKGETRLELRGSCENDHLTLVMGG